MPKYSYISVDKAGNRKKKTADASDIDKIKKSEIADGNYAIMIKEMKGLNTDIGVKKKAKSKELAIMCKQLSNALSTLPIITSLTLTADTTNNKGLSNAMLEVADDISNGETISSSIKKHEIFPNILSSAITAGEESGNLEEAFARMAVQFERTAKIKGQIKKAMIYPIAILVVSIAVVIIASIYIIPKFQEMLADAGAKLPLITKIMVGISYTVKHRWYILIAVALVICFGFPMYLKSASGKIKKDFVLLRVPVVKDMVIKRECAGFSRTMSTLLKSGMLVHEAMVVAANTAENHYFKEAIANCKTDIMNGSAMSASLRKAELFPKMLLAMIENGEKTGNTVEMLSDAADMYEEEVANATAAVVNLMEPAIILFMAGVVGMIIASIYIPMMSLYSNIG